MSLVIQILIMKIIDWVQHHKVIIFLSLVIVYLVLSNRNSASLMNVNYAAKMSVPFTGGGESSGAIQDVSPRAGIQNRLIISDSTLSLQVKNVTETLSKIKGFVSSLGGYFVDSNLDRPEESASGSITVRVPSEKLDEVLLKIKSFSVKVVSENLHGTDVTDQYVDNDERLKVLMSNKTRFSEIMNRAVTVDEILKVQQQIFDLQNQIDAIKGQQLYLTNNAKLTKITIYLATDELALPYAPSESWRPEVIFKEAVRSLIQTVRGGVNLLIWIVVYSAVWIPLLMIAVILKKKLKK